MGIKTEDLLAAWGAFFVAHALAVRQIEDGLKAKAMLSLDEYDVLLGIYRAPGGRIRFSDLASVTVFTRSGITRVVRRLENSGLLERVVCSEDRRGAFAVLTTKGKETMRQTWKLYSRQILEIFEPCFDRAEAQQLKNSLEKIVERIRNEQIVQIGKLKT